MEVNKLHQAFDSLVSNGKNLVLLGMGREGVSSYKVFRKLYPKLDITIVDRNTEISNLPVLQGDSCLEFCTGEAYLDALEKEIEKDRFSIVLKTPGVSLKDHPKLLFSSIVSSQTDLFLRFWGAQCVGITGTKGKSTTTHLVYHLLKDDFSCVLAGNMGIPFFDILPEIKPETKIICELSSHQLEQVKKPPRVGVLLNLYEEHLDHYNSFEDYQKSKMNICGGDFFIWNIDDCLIAERLAERIKREGIEKLGQMCVFTQDYKKTEGLIHCYEERIKDLLRKDQNTINSTKEGQIFDFNLPNPLVGKHNELNLMAALLASRMMGGEYKRMVERLASFEPLPHRLQYVGCYDKIHFFNDSISTIPQACIAAVESINELPYIDKVGCLILGGFDRGIDYKILEDYLSANPIESIAFVGQAGNRIYRELEKRKSLPKRFICSDNYFEIVKWAKENTGSGNACVLSPAAASYDSFKNFEERGDCFVSLLKA